MPCCLAGVLAAQVIGTCSVRGKYAQVGANNWPAQLIICGDPPGASSCAGAVYNSSLPVIEPGALLRQRRQAPRQQGCKLFRRQHSCSILPLRPAVCGSAALAAAAAETCCLTARVCLCRADNVTYDGVTYTATYTFQVTPAWIAPQPITYRYFACLYNNTNGAISQRSGASLDVVSCLPAEGSTAWLQYSVVRGPTAQPHVLPKKTSAAVLLWQALTHYRMCVWVCVAVRPATATPSHAAIATQASMPQPASQPASPPVQPAHPFASQPASQCGAQHQRGPVA